MQCNNLTYSKAEILNSLQNKGPDLEELILAILKGLSECKAFLKTVTSHILNNQGNLQDAEDMIQEGLAQLAINLYENKYRGEASIENYAFSICKFKWNNFRRKKSRIQYPGNDNLPHFSSQTYTETDSGEHEKMIWLVIEKMSLDCKNLLKLVYKGLSYQDIGERLNFAEQTIKNKVSGCRKKIRHFLEEHPDFKVYFYR